MQSLFNLIDRLRTLNPVRWLYHAVRFGMGFTFIASGMRKLPGVRFTILPETDPVGAFFQAMYETGIYWHSIAYFQIAIGLLVFFSRTTILGSLLMMPITWNIFMVSVALNMRGTPVITATMLLGNIFLLLWNYENYLSLLRRPERLAKVSD